VAPAPAEATVAPTADATTATATAAASHHRRLKIFICCPFLRQWPEPRPAAGCRRAVSLFVRVRGGRDLTPRRKKSTKWPR